MCESDDAVASAFQPFCALLIILLQVCCVMISTIQLNNKFHRQAHEICNVVSYDVLSLKRFA